MANDGWWPWSTLQLLIAAASAAPAGERPSAQIYWLLGVVIGLLAIAYPPVCC